jgi:thioredoxin 1
VFLCNQVLEITFEIFLKPIGGSAMLDTDLTHLETLDEAEKTIEESENLMVCCGRMGPMCVPVYAIMEEIEDEYSHVTFRDMDFDIPEAAIIRNLPECQGFTGLPFTVYFKNGKVVKATSSIQTKQQVTSILDAEFGKSE